MADTKCKYHESSIQCMDKTQCYRCGWNPEVEAERKAEAVRRTSKPPPPPVYEKPTKIVKWR